MKIAVAVTISKPGSQIGTLAENAPFYPLFSKSGGFLEAIDNPFAQLPQGGETESNAQRPFTSRKPRKECQMGIAIDALSDEQRAYLSSWQEGT